MLMESANSRVAQLMASATRAQAEGRLKDCQSISETLLKQFPDFVPALVMLGVVKVKMEMQKEAIPIFERAISVDPKCAPAYLWLSMVHRKLGQNPEALKQAIVAVRLTPSDPLGQHHLGLCYLDSGELKLAETTLRKSASMAPNVAIVHYSLGLALQALGNRQEATASLRLSARLDPSSIQTQVALRELLYEGNDLKGATEAARTILRLQPNSAEAHLWLARVLNEQNRQAEAKSHVERAKKLDPDSALAHTLLGSSLQMSGDLEGAELHFQKSIEMLPRQGSAYLALATNRKLKESDGEFVSKIQELLRQGDLPPLTMSELHYALGKAMEDLGQFQTAMEQFDAANLSAYRAKFGSRPYDRRALNTYDRMAEKFSRAFLEEYRAGGSESQLPIFVVGMIRSGTTLVEQILSSHPIVGAAGEQDFWLEKGAMAFLGSNLDRLDRATLNRLGEQYERLLRELSPDQARVVDKMPMNFIMLGVIHLAFPHAKIIHTRRNPLDTCISIYTTPNRTHLGWAHDKANIVYSFNKYRGLMEHWSHALPPGTMLEIDYEDLVGDQEQTTRKLLEFCGLDWSDSCLYPEQNKRAVVTPSVSQVRQPVYKTSVNRGKKYEPWLGAFADLQ